MKFAPALLPIAAALQFVEAGPVAAEGLVCASIFPSQNLSSSLLSCCRPSVLPFRSEVSFVMETAKRALQPW